jgi:hypothetical protein
MKRPAPIKLSRLWFSFAVNFYCVFREFLYASDKYFTWYPLLFVPSKKFPWSPLLFENFSMLKVKSSLGLSLLFRNFIAGDQEIFP